MVFHFAGHAEQRPPSQGRAALYCGHAEDPDGAPLTTADIAGLRCRMAARVERARVLGMALDQDGVILPRLRPVEVARRGVILGLLGAMPLVVAALSIPQHSNREEFLSVISGLTGLFGAMLLVIGAGFWWASAGDIRRLRDWSTVTTQGAAITLIGPLFLRSGLFLLVFGAVAFGLHQLVATAPYGSWLHG
ncbi:DUF6336 family protein [Streptomyces indiaensis]|uniref:Integral membrane protein n=1 Tax=Streptomyces indiaensis TaxID=284033 RepID=A0ABN3E4I1_9ACTN